MYSSEAAISGRVRVRYGFIDWIIIGGIIFLFLWTYFVCGVIRGDWPLDIDLPGSSVELGEPGVIVTAYPGFIGLNTEILEDSNVVKVISTSSLPVDVVVKAEEGQDIFTYRGLMPSEYFLFEWHTGTCTVSAVAS